MQKQRGPLLISVSGMLAVLITTVVCGDQKTQRSIPTASPTLSNVQAKQLPESVEKIVSKFRAEKAAAMEAYLDASPLAGDAPKLFEELIQYYEGIGDRQRCVEILEKQYALLRKGPEGDYQTASANWAKRFDVVWKGQLSSQSDLERSKAIFDQVRKDFPQSRNDEWFNFQESKLKLPCVGDTLDVAFTAVDGRAVDIREMRGKVVLVSYWQSAAENDLKELAQIKSLYEKHHVDGFEVVGICLDENKTDLDRIVEQEGIDWPQAFEGKGSESPLAKKYFIFFTPFNLLIGRDGKMVNRNLKDAELDNAVKDLMQ